MEMSIERLVKILSVFRDETYKETEHNLEEAQKSGDQDLIDCAVMNWTEAYGIDNTIKAIEDSIINNRFGTLAELIKKYDL